MHAVAPLDDGDPVAADELVESEVVQLLQVIEAVDVEVARAAAGPSYRARAVNVGLTTGSVTPSARGEALGEHRLAACRARRRARRRRRRATPRRCAARGRASRRRSRARVQLHRALVATRGARFTATKSARACASAAPPPRRTADGCSAGISTASSRYGNSRPRSFVMPSLVSSSSLVAKLPERHDEPRIDELHLRARGTGGTCRSRRAAGRGCPAGGTSRRWRCTRRPGSSPMPSISVVSRRPGPAHERLAGDGPPPPRDPRPRT